MYSLPQSYNQTSKCKRCICPNAYVISGIAFDRYGNRLGHGKGYYDKLLAQLSNVYKIGLCFSFQFVEELPVAENDIKMDIILTTNQK